MADRLQLKIIEENPIAEGLGAILFNKCSSVPCTPDVLDELSREDLQKLAMNLLFLMQSLPIVDQLASRPLLNAVLSENPDDILIWTQVYNAITESTPPPRPVVSSVQQTPAFRNTSSLANSAEHQKDMDDGLKKELDPMYIGVPDFHETYFGDVAGLETASKAVFEKCVEGSNPLFHEGEGWSGWPKNANQDGVLKWFADVSEKLVEFAEGHKSIPTQRKLLANPNAPIGGSVATRKMDIGFADCSKARKGSRYQWSQVLVPGELKSNPSADRASELGFDSTIITSNGERYIEIERNGIQERLIIDKKMLRASCIVGRATTCWKAHWEGDAKRPLVIKDSWQYMEREEEGDLLREATNRGVVNLGRYYHHYTVQALGTDDDIRSNVRKGLDITKAEKCRLERSMTPSTADSRKSSGSTANRKRSASQSDAPPPSKRSRLASSTNIDSSELPNRVHRRIILRDYGEHIYNASSRAALLGALEGCIEGHESLHKAGILHRDISINNLMINEDEENPSCSSFLIDLDLSIKKEREGVTEANGKTGTRAFMAIGVLDGEKHSFMHDLESFFWVLFWICIHYKEPGKAIGATEFDRWNYENDFALAMFKRGVISDELAFLNLANSRFTPYYQPLIPCINKLRREVFPNGHSGAEERGIRLLSSPQQLEQITVRPCK
ncbi:uncharacterized protein DFL_009282 [Arthrobotrys flagrans]|uniref:non-specific serine/threonine protein kinase n=1 Tax=Arthrobotrys flagrans TaxID=97331 RepID=A0A436ZR66_ARTFL|nr:hypothetical protein DFL_009282 [Arthrobotrys flagrans]